METKKSHVFSKTQKPPQPTQGVGANEDIKYLNIPPEINKQINKATTGNANDKL